MRSIKAVQPQCKNCSNLQGGTLRQIVRDANQYIISQSTTTTTNGNGQ
jgi:hypothetical protein